MNKKIIYLICFILMVLIFYKCASFKVVDLPLLDEPLNLSKKIEYKNHAYEEEFNSMLKTLLNKYYNENGRWKNDMGWGDGGCSVINSARLFYKIGYEKKRTDLIRLAGEHAEFTYQLISSEDPLKAAMSGRFINAISFPSLIIAYKYEKKEEYAKKIETVFRKANTLIHNWLEKIYKRREKFVIPMISYANILYTINSGKKDSAVNGLNYLLQLKKKFWDKYGIFNKNKKKKLNSFHLAFFLTSLVTAFRITGDQIWMDHIEEIKSYFENKLWHSRKKGYGKSRKDGIRGLSTQTIILEAYIDLYEITGDKWYFNKSIE